MKSDYQFFAHTKGGDTLLPQPFEVFAYPMGDTTVRRVKDRPVHGGAQVMVVRSAAPDWSLIAAWADLLRDFDRRILVLPYLPSARGDKDVPSPARTNAVIAARLGITDLITLDPHSNVWLDTFRAASDHRINVHVLDLPKLVTYTVPRLLELDGVIAPDAGARERAGAVAAAFGLPLFTASKHRDPDTGKLSGYVAPNGVVEDGSYLVVDDICDGGGTFILLADAMPASVEMHLWVSHGGFTKGVQALVNRYTTLFTTNSLPSAGEAAVGYGAVVVRDLMRDITNAVKGLV